ncbi:MAG: zinc ribbon domain-containing protein, partial [Pyrinomonadaceae bacterium]
MNERCDNCGAELFAGQQFCRQCGAPTRQLSAGEIPTQILPGGQDQSQQQQSAGQARAATTPLGSRDTDEVYRSRVAQFLNPPPAAPIAPMSTMALEGGERSSWRGWLIALVCVLGFLVIGSIFAASYVARQFAQRKVIVNRGRQGVKVEVPPLPPMP